MPAEKNIPSFSPQTAAAEQPLTPTPDQAPPLDALTTLAVMSANQAPPRCGVHAIFAVDSMGGKPFSGQTIKATGSYNPQIVQRALRSMVDLNMLTVGRVSYIHGYSYTAEPVVAEVADDYNELYGDLLQQKTGQDIDTLYGRAAGMAAAAYKLPRNMAKFRLLERSALEAGVGRAHMTWRALSALAHSLGAASSVEAEIARKIADNPLANKQQAQQSTTGGAHE